MNIGLKACALLGLTLLASCALMPAHQARKQIETVPEVRSSAGVAAFRLDAVLTKHGTPAFEYIGKIGIAPTIRVNPGDRIEIALHNAMHAQRNASNDVNLHFHGLIVSPNAQADDVLTMVAHSGQTIHYVVPIPANHEPGLYWYHPHIHGQTFWQVANGMSGVIVVEGLERHIPALANMRERIVVLRQKPTGLSETRTATISEADDGGYPCRPEIALRPTIDGQPREQFEIGRGEQQFFRVVNASASRYFDLSIDGVRLQLVALDGVPLDAYPGASAVLTINHIVISPAGRAEFVVQGPAHSRMLRAWCVDSGSAGDAQPPKVLGELVVDSSAPATPTVLRVVSPLPPNVLSDPPPLPAVRRTIRLTEDANNFYIDGKTFDMKAMMGPAAVVAHAGTVEEWNIMNDTDEVHDFHIHQVHFAEEEAGGDPVSVRHWTALLARRSGRRKDQLHRDDCSRWRKVVRTAWCLRGLKLVHRHARAISSRALTSHQDRLLRYHSDPSRCGFQ